MHSMKHFILIAVGSRGDTEPFCSLARELQKNHEKDDDEVSVSIDLFIQKDMTGLAPKEDSITIHELPFTMMDFYKYSTKSDLPGCDHPNPRVKFVGIVAEVIGELVMPCGNQLAKAVRNDTTMIIASSLARQLALAVAATQPTAIPVGLVQLQPMQPVSAFPHYSHTEGDCCIKAILELSSANNSDVSDELAVANLETYWEPEKYQDEFLLERLKKTYANLGIESAVPNFEADMKPILLGERDNIKMINAFSHHLVPAVNETAWNIGPLADCYIHDDWSPPADLVAFLKEHPRPVCVGYGSMPFGATQVILDALKELDRPAVLVGACFVSALEALSTDDGDNQTWSKANLFAISSAPYPWLLPQCSMMLSHGGAGVVNATLRAGIPNVISPLMGDQFFWAKLLAAKKMGVAADGAFTTMTTDGMRSAIQAASNTAIQEEAARVGEAIRAETCGAKRLADKLLAF
jgi:hypothetical protein